MLLLIVAVLFWMGWNTTDSYLEDARVARATLGAMALKQACQAYALNPANAGNEYPKRLGDLVEPPFGGASLLRNGIPDLIDPWGRVYRYEVVKAADGTETPRVWSERVVNGRKRVIESGPPGK